MKTENFCKENRPEAKKKLRLPDQLELMMEDGTVYRVRSFFAAEQQMGDVQDATDHKINLVLCKDLSRLGRDYIEAGKYTDFVFPSLGCRFIALNPPS